MAPTELVEHVDKLDDDAFRRHALAILERELGVYGLARFIRIYRPGIGNYTQERHQWLDGLSVEEAMREL